MIWKNCYAIFTYVFWGRYGGIPRLGGSGRLAACGVKSIRSFAKQNSIPNAARLERGGLSPICVYYLLKPPPLVVDSRF
jgi:hypothetical protein